MRSTFPSKIRRGGSPTSNSGNLMVDEPPLIARMRGLADFIVATGCARLRGEPPRRHSAVSLAPYSAPPGGLQARLRDRCSRLLPLPVAARASPPHAPV